MTPPDLVSIIGQKQEVLPVGLKDAENLNPLFNHLPRCPYLLVNRLGAIIADRKPVDMAHRAKKNDLDLIVPVSCCDAETWDELAGLPAETFDVWGDSDALVTRDNMYFILNPRYQSLNRAEKQQKVCEIIAMQIKGTDDVVVHRITTGETILKVDSTTPSLPHAELFPLILEPNEDQERALANLGYLPDQGMVAISPSQNIYRVSISNHTSGEFTPDLEVYANKSPHQAIMFLRRLVKSTLNSIRYQSDPSLRAKRVDEFWLFHHKLMADVILCNTLDEGAQSSLKSLDKKVKKLAKSQYP